MINDRPEHRVADALRNVARRLDEQLGEGRSWKIDAEDLLETLLAIADDLDPPLQQPNRKNR
jgi:hypothetical protein